MFIRQLSFRRVMSDGVATTMNDTRREFIGQPTGPLRLLWQRGKLSPQPICAIVVTTSKDEAPARDSHSADSRRLDFRVDRAVNLLNDSTRLNGRQIVGTRPLSQPQLSVSLPHSAASSTSSTRHRCVILRRRRRRRQRVFSAYRSVAAVRPR